MLFSGYMEEKKQTKIKFMIYPEVKTLDQLRQLAEKHDRSINGEIITAIKNHLAQHKQQ